MAACARPTPGEPEHRHRLARVVRSNQRAPSAAARPRPRPRSVSEPLAARFNAHRKSEASPSSPNWNERKRAITAVGRAENLEELVHGVPTSAGPAHLARTGGKASCWSSPRLETGSAHRSSPGTAPAPAPPRPAGMSAVRWRSRPAQRDRELQRQVVQPTALNGCGSSPVPARCPRGTDQRVAVLQRLDQRRQRSPLSLRRSRSTPDGIETPRWWSLPKARLRPVIARQSTG